MEPQVIAIIVQTAIFLLGGFAVAIKTGAKTNELEADVSGIREEMKELTKVITKIAVQSERLDNISLRMNMQEKRMEELSREVDWKRGHGGVEGEYSG